MKLVELTIPTNTADLDQLMKNAGYSKLGHGEFGRVYHKGNLPYVLKVFTARDHAYIDFIKLVTVHKNPHFPKFHKKLVKISDIYYGIRMEKLTEFDDDEYSTIDKIRTFTKGDYVEEIEMYRNGTFNELELQSLLQSIDFRNALISYEFMIEHPTLKEACELIRDILLPKYDIDIRSNNLMMRDNTIVIIDPVYDESALF